MEDARSRILQTSLKLFSAHGFAGTTTREIARQAGVAEVTLFRHFPSKEKLFEDVVAEHLPGPDFRDVLTRARALEYRQALESIATSFLAALRERKDLIVLMYTESHRHFALMERVYAALFANLTALLAEYFRELQEQGLIRPFTPEAGAQAFLGVWVAHYEAEELLPTSNMKQHSPSQLIGEYVDIFVFGTQRRDSPA